MSYIVLFTNGINRFLYDGGALTSHPGVLVLADPNIAHMFPPLDPGVLYYHDLTFDLIADDATPLQLSWPQLLSWYTGIQLPPVPMIISQAQQATLGSLFQRFVASRASGASAAVNYGTSLGT